MARKQRKSDFALTDKKIHNALQRLDDADCAQLYGLKRRRRR